MAAADHRARDEYHPIRRQAVVVVHGQGQPRPMGTIRDFVKVLWSFNAQLGPLTPQEQQTGRKTWIVPDDKGGLFELQRITTPELNGRRTDFFELYYADLLDETPVRNLWLWLQRLLWIDREDVTARMRWPWTLFWVINLVALGLFIALIIRIPDLLGWSWLEPLTSSHARIPLIIIAVAALVLLLPRFSTWFGWLGMVPARIPIVVIAAAVVVIYWPRQSTLPYDYPVILPLMVLGALGYLVGALILPYFGDAASYLSAQTQTVRSREAVRRRGLQMLRALHDDPAYDRIVVIAHSLGSVLAYDLLQILWQDVGPTKDNRPTPEALAALLAVDAHTASMDGAAWTEADVSDHQELQWKAFDALRQTKAVPAAGHPAVIGGWKISDFVSLGSPLASAQFLITEGREDFARMKTERVLPTAPPQPYEPGELAVHDANGSHYLHHAAVFSTVRWTNLYDEFHPFLVVIGDVISGPVVPQFGPAIRDVRVRIERPGLFSRLFTHDRYWIDGADAGAPLPHIVALRDAVGLGR